MMVLDTRKRILYVNILVMRVESHEQTYTLDMLINKSGLMMLLALDSRQVSSIALIAESEFTTATTTKMLVLHVTAKRKLRPRRLMSFYRRARRFHV